MSAGPSREDIVFGRAVIAFRLTTKEQVEACAADQKRLQDQGRPFTLAQIMVGRKLLSIEQYRRTVQEIEKRLAAAPSPSPAASSSPSFRAPPPGATGESSARVRRDATAARGERSAAAPPAAWSGAQAIMNPVRLLPPDITASGHYSGLGTFSQGSKAPAHAPPPPSDEEIEEAARSWEEVSRVLDRDAVARATDRGGKADSGIPATDDPGFELVPASDPSPSKRLTTPQAAKERRDAGIRKVLGVPEEAEEFDFGPYRILGEVASGGMGVIYRALETATGSIYALKALLNVESANEKQLKRFVQEAQSAMRLDHPGIVKIYDLGVFENIPYFTMDMIPGKDLHHLLRDKAYSQPKTLEILRKVCDAVDYAHKQGVIHRDLKPANIIVRPDEVPILTDFGLAKNLDSQFKLTAEGAMVGTPLYLSPEQVSGQGALVDARCDVYGLGVMLYQILTDRFPFFGRNPYEVYRKVTEEDPPTPSSLNPEVSPEIERVCLQALAKRREERYPSAKAMGDDIARFLRREPVRATLPSPAPKKVSARVAPQGSAADDVAPDSGASLKLIFAVGAFLLVIFLGVAYIVSALLAD